MKASPKEMAAVEWCVGLHDRLAHDGVDALSARHVGEVLRDGQTVSRITQNGRKRPTFSAHLSDGRILSLHFLIVSRVVGDGAYGRP